MFGGSWWQATTVACTVHATTERSVQRVVNSRSRSGSGGRVISVAVRRVGCPATGLQVRLPRSVITFVDKVVDTVALRHHVHLSTVSHPVKGRSLHRVTFY